MSIELSRTLHLFYLQVMEVEHMNTYFKNVQTLEELRKQYKVLLKKYHPDNGNGSEEIFKIE